MTTLFEVPFRSAMRDADLARLRAELGMTTNAHVQAPAVQPPLGFVRLDFDSGLYLVRRAGDEEWALECRTSGAPASGTVRGWWLLAVHAARQLDPSVPAPSPGDGQPVALRAAARPPSQIPMVRR